MKISQLSILLFLLFQIALTKFSSAQDTLQLRSGEILIGRIITVGDVEITYKLPTDLNGPTFVIRKSKVLYIFLESGTVINYSNRSLEVSAKRAAQLTKLKVHKNSIKWETLSSLTNDICFGYERHLFRNQSIEFKIAYIGTGNESVEKRYSSKGFFI